MRFSFLRFASCISRSFVLILTFYLPLEYIILDDTNIPDYDGCWCFLCDDGLARGKQRFVNSCSFYYQVIFSNAERGFCGVIDLPMLHDYFSFPHSNIRISPSVNFWISVSDRHSKQISPSTLTEYPSKSGPMMQMFTPIPPRSHRHHRSHPHLQIYRSS
nr:MAG TPA: hypothetical protein [Caudoviricetes sp.]